MLTPRRIFQRVLRRLATELGVLLYDVQETVARETLPRFGNKPKNLRIDFPRRIVTPERIFLGDDVWLGPGSLLMAVTRYPGPAILAADRRGPSQVFDSRVVIGDRVTSTANLQVAAHAEIVIESDVLLASNISISDGLHGYAHPEEPYKYQEIFRIAPIIIKRGSWIGQNVVILPGVTVGESAIIGANSVVTRDVPDRCIAVGAPARVAKEWQEASRTWLRAEQQAHVPQD